MSIYDYIYLFAHKVLIVKRRINPVKKFEKTYEYLNFICHYFNAMCIKMLSPVVYKKQY